MFNFFKKKRPFRVEITVLDPDVELPKSIAEMQEDVYQDTIQTMGENRAKAAIRNKEWLALHESLCCQAMYPRIWGKIQLRIYTN